MATSQYTLSQRIRVSPAKAGQCLVVELLQPNQPNFILIWLDKRFVAYAAEYPEQDIHFSSAGVMFYFNNGVDVLRKEDSHTSGARLVKIDKRMSQFLGKYTWHRRADGPAGARTETRLIIRLLEQKNFDRPFYNQRLLRWLFRSYRNGNMLLGHLFKAVAYIELWHLLFIDKDSPIRFDPRNDALNI